MIDAEINTLLNDSYKRAMNILVTHKKELHLLSGIWSIWCSCNLIHLISPTRGPAEIWNTWRRGRENNYRAEETSHTEDSPELWTAGSQACPASVWTSGTSSHCRHSNRRETSWGNGGFLVMRDLNCVLSDCLAWISTQKQMWSKYIFISSHSASPNLSIKKCKYPGFLTWSCISESHHVVGVSNTDFWATSSRLCPFRQCGYR